MPSLGALYREGQLLSIIIGEPQVHTSTKKLLNSQLASPAATTDTENMHFRCEIQMRLWYGNNRH